jgi:hypothetical protein
MRIYIIGNDGITLCREAPASVTDGEIAVASQGRSNGEKTDRGATVAGVRGSLRSIAAGAVQFPKSGLTARAQLIRNPGTILRIYGSAIPCVTLRRQPLYNGAWPGRPELREAVSCVQAYCKNLPSDHGSTGRYHHAHSSTTRRQQMWARPCQCAARCTHAGKALPLAREGIKTP